MRVLVVSRTPWNDANSFGNTFSNLFGGMKGVEIYNICCQDGKADNDVVVQAYQMTDSAVLRSIVGKPAGCIMEKVGSTKDYSAPIGNSISMPKHRITLFYLCRDIIWKLGRWKSRSLMRFLDEVKPDVLYLPVYHSAYMTEVQWFVMRYTSVPAVVHITDELYAYPPRPWTTPFKSLYHMWLRGKNKRLIRQARYGEVFAEDMAIEYNQVFGIPFYVIGKGVNISDVMPNTDWSPSDVFTFVYTGNYGGERGSALIELAQAIAKQPRKARLMIYSTTHAEAETDHILAETGVVEFAGAVRGAKVGLVQRKADCLVHVEGFSDRSIYETRLSFSTKIIDYLMAMRPILAIGPAEVNSIKVLAKHRLAIIADSLDSIPATVDTIMTSDYVPTKAVEYLTTYRDKTQIQAEILNRLNLICNR